MLINQNGLNSLMSITRPKNYLDALREEREGLMKKLNQGTIFNNNAKGTDKSSDSSNVDKKQLLQELQASDKKIQMALYEEKSLKLKLERLKREEATARDPRKKEKILAEHESVLYNASMGKLLSASGKSSGLRTMVGDGAVLSLSQGCLENESNGSQQHSIAEKVEEIDMDLKESMKFGIEAAEVARRRRYNQINEAIEAAAQKSAARRKKGKKSSINITV